MRPFAGGGSYEFFVERSTPPDPSCLDRWKALVAEGWDVEALVDEQATTMIGIGLRYPEASARRATG